MRNYLLAAMLAVAVVGCSSTSTKEAASVTDKSSTGTGASTSGSTTGVVTGSNTGAGLPAG